MGDDERKTVGWKGVGVVAFVSAAFAIGVSMTSAAVDYGRLAERVDGTTRRVTVLEGERPVLVQIQKDIARLTANSEATRDDMREMKGQMMGRPASWDHRRAEIERAGGDDETALKGGE